MIRRCPRPTGNFCVFSNDVVNDPRLSWGARGTLLYLLAKPDHWTVSVANLVNQTAEAVGVASGRDAVYTVLRELMITRYIKRVQMRRDDGTMAGVEYIVSELPFAEEELGDDFLTKKQLTKRRSSLAAKKRSFAALKGAASATVVDAPAGGVSPPSVRCGIEPLDASALPVDISLPTDDGMDMAPMAAVEAPRDALRADDTSPDSTQPLDVAQQSPSAQAETKPATPAQAIDVAAGASPVGGEPAAQRQARARSTTPPRVFSPLPDHPEAVQPDTANTTQVNTHLKKRLIGSNNAVARARKTGPEPKRRSTGKAPDIELFDATTLTGMGVDPKVAATWLAVRARKRAVNSMLALEGVQAQASEAGLSLGDALRMAAENSWQGFRADWVKRNDRTSDKAARRPPRSGAQMTEEELAESMRKAKAELFGEICDGGAGNWLEPTLLDRDGDMWRAPS